MQLPSRTKVPRVSAPHTHGRQQLQRAQGHISGEPLTAGGRRITCRGQAAAQPSRTGLNIQGAVGGLARCCLTGLARWQITPLHAGMNCMLVQCAFTNCLRAMNRWSSWTEVALTSSADSHLQAHGYRVTDAESWHASPQADGQTGDDAHITESAAQPGPPGSPTGAPLQKDQRPPNGAPALPPEHPPPAAPAEGGTNGGAPASSLRSMSDTRKAKFKKLLDQQVRQPQLLPPPTVNPAAACLFADPADTGAVATHPCLLPGRCMYWTHHAHLNSSSHRQQPTGHALRRLHPSP